MVEYMPQNESRTPIASSDTNNVIEGPYYGDRLYVSVGLGCITLIGTVIISVLLLIGIMVVMSHPAHALSLPEIQPMRPQTLLYQYAYGSGLSDWEYERLVRIMDCESKNDPHARNKHSSAKGLFQFLDSSWKQWGHGSVFNPRENIIATIKYYKHSGFKPWVCK